MIFHFHYTTWPDFGVPESPASFLNFLFKVRESGCLDPEHGPAVIHCSAGIGRSGTFSLVDTCLVLVSLFICFVCLAPNTQYVVTSGWFEKQVEISVLHSFEMAILIITWKWKCQWGPSVFRNQHILRWYSVNMFYNKVRNNCTTIYAWKNIFKAVCPLITAIKLIFFSFIDGKKRRSIFCGH